MFKITDVKAREVFNCDWDPTIEAVVEVGGITGSSIAPTGQSTGMYEAAELRDGGDRFEGRGCHKAIANINTEIRQALIGMDVTDQKAIDQVMIELDGTPNKSRLGANATTAVSAAVTDAAAKATGLPLYKYMNDNAYVLPVPMLDFITGSHYAFGSSSEIQEFSVLPIKADTFEEALFMARTVYKTLAEIIVEKYGLYGLCTGSAGSYTLPLKSSREILQFLQAALDRSGLGEHFGIGMDCAASGWFNEEKAMYQFEGQLRSREEMLDFYKALIREFPIVTLEDPFDENDDEGFVRATRELGIQIVGDDYFVTNPAIFEKKSALGAATAMLWKYNQIGTISQAWEAAELAKSKGYTVMPSERSGESQDCLLADYTVALNAGCVKTGICVQSENVAKYNRLIQIERDLGEKSVYAGVDFRKVFM